MTLVSRPGDPPELAAWRRHDFNDGERRLRLPGFPEVGLASSRRLPAAGLSADWLRGPPQRAVLLDDVALATAMATPRAPGLFHDVYCMGPSQLVPAPSATASRLVLKPQDLLLQATGMRRPITELTQTELDRLPAATFAPAFAPLLSVGRPLRSNLSTLRPGVPYRLLLLPSPAAGKIIDALATALVVERPHWRAALYAAAGAAPHLPSIHGRLSVLVERCPQGSDCLRRLQSLQQCLPNVRIELHYLRHAELPHLHGLHDATQTPPQMPVLAPWPLAMVPAARW